MTHYWRSDLDFMYTKRKDMNMMHVSGIIEGLSLHMQHQIVFNIKHGRAHSNN